MIDRYAERCLRLAIESDRRHASALLMWPGATLEMERTLTGDRQRVESECVGTIYGRYRGACERIDRLESELAWHLGERERARRAAA